jgi:hypothetical protein
MKVYRCLLLVQSVYILITAVWPLIDIHSFMYVTGPKQDVWLVKTVGALLIPVGISLGVHLIIRSNFLPAFLLGSLTALAFSLIDFYYALRGTISPVYLLDGALEVLFLFSWIYVYSTLKFKDRNVKHILTQELL